MHIPEPVNKLLHWVGNERVKRNLLKSLPFWVAAFISGGLAVLYARIYAFAEDQSLYLLEQEPVAFLITAPLCFLLAMWTVHRYAPFAQGSGVPQVVTAVELSNPRTYPLVGKLLGLRLIVVKILSSVAMVFGGGVVGREGPTIQISASVFKKINDILPDWYPKLSKRNMIITGAAAGLASAFNTPLGGIVFAIEELTKTHVNFFKSALLTGVIIAGLTSLYFLGPYLYLGYPDLTTLSSSSILAIIPVATITAIAGSYTGRWIVWMLKRLSRVPFKRKMVYVAVCGLAIASIGVWLGAENIGSGKELMRSTLFTSDKGVQWYTPILRVVGSVVSFTTGAAGGIFAPALSSGASIGSVFAEWFHFGPADTNVLILCGMVGFLTSITGTPFTASIIVLEMTDSHDVIFHLMLTALVAYLVSRMVSRRSVYDRLRQHYLETIRSGHALDEPVEEEGTSQEK